MKHLSNSAGGRRLAFSVAAATALAIVAIVLAWNPFGLGADGSSPERAASAAATTEGERPDEETTAPEESSPADVDEPSGLAPSPPVALRIPAIEVESPLLRLGLNDDGTVEVPSYEDSDTAGWYEHSVTPGQEGAAVILGHIDTVEGPAVFGRLTELVPGDTISVERADGATVVFEVDRIESHPKTDFPTVEVYGDVDHPALRLITCGGSFDEDTGSYTDNIIVYAELAD